MFDKAEKILLFCNAKDEIQVERQLLTIRNVNEFLQSKIVMAERSILTFSKADNFTRQGG